MSDKADRATAIDIDVLNTLEQLGGLTSDRTETFNKLMKAKIDISELTLEELMIKDLKVVNNIPLVGFCLLVEVCCNFLLLSFCDILHTINILCTKYIFHTISEFSLERKCQKNN